MKMCTKMRLLLATMMMMQFVHSQLVTSDVAAYPSSATGTLSGELKQWHKITLGFQGPFTNETATKNPFTSFRLDVRFVNSAAAVEFTVPGYYAADGNAANSGATSGNVWLTHFSPSVTGNWTWRANFTTGTNVAQKGNGTIAGFFHGATGNFTIGATDKTGRDFRGKGLLQYVGEHHLRFANGEWFLKAGTDCPENFLAYEDFDNTPNYGDRRKNWTAHAGDYKVGDPTWAGGKGSEMIGGENIPSIRLSRDGRKCRCRQMRFLTIYATLCFSRSVELSGRQRYERLFISHNEYWR
jgi:Domain of unknown function (DUF5060)